MILGVFWGVWLGIIATQVMGYGLPYLSWEWGWVVGGAVALGYAWIRKKLYDARVGNGRPLPRQFGLRSNKKGNEPEEPVRIGIVGGGVTGLSLAYYLQSAAEKAGVEMQISLVEAREETGGWIGAGRVGGAWFENGPRSLRPAGGGIVTMALVKELGLEDCVVVADPVSRNRMLWMDPQKWDSSSSSSSSSASSSSASSPAMQFLPRSILGVLTSPLLAPCLYAIAREPFVAPREVEGEADADWDSAGADETIAEFVSRRFSPQMARLLFDPMLIGVFAGKSTAISVRAAFPQIIRLEDVYGSLVVGGVCEGIFSLCSNLYAWLSRTPQPYKIPGVFTFAENGLSVLLEGMKSALDPGSATVATGVRVTSLDRSSPDGPIVMATESADEGAKEMEVDHVFLATPIPVAASLLDTLPHNGELQSTVLEMGSIPHANVGVVNVVFRGGGSDQSILPPSLRGFGYLIPSWMDSVVLGVILDSCTFPSLDKGQEVTRVTAMVGGAVHPEWETEYPDDASLVATVLDVFATHLGLDRADVDAAVIDTRVSRLSNAIAQYPVGHVASVLSWQSNLASSSTPITLVGNGYTGVGVNDCIAASHTIARDFVQALTSGQ